MKWCDIAYHNLKGPEKTISPITLCWTLHLEEKATASLQRNLIAGKETGYINHTGKKHQNSAIELINTKTMIIIPIVTIIINRNFKKLFCCPC